MVATRGVVPRPDTHINNESAIEYWNSVSPDVNGMLGGYPQISRVDLQGSANFIAKLRRGTTTGKSDTPLLMKRAADCGAGIGRITKGLLVNVAEVVDIVEPVAKFTDEIKAGEDFLELREQGGLGHVFTFGLEAWRPADSDVRYDLIWNQWCLGQLKDQQLIAYLENAKRALLPGGWIVVKENMATDIYGRDIFDDTDSSVTRTDESFRFIFDRAGLQVKMSELQRGFPKSLGLYPVRMYALQPGPE